MKFLFFTPVTCPSINNFVSTQGSRTTQATSSRTLPNVTVEGTRSTKGMMTIQPIRTFNVTRIRPVRIRPPGRMRQAIKKVDRTVHPAITTQLNTGRFYYMVQLFFSEGSTTYTPLQKKHNAWLSGLSRSHMGSMSLKGQTIIR